jgi:hypothetical protein
MAPMVLRLMKYGLERISKEAIVAEWWWHYTVICVQN